MGGSFQSPIRAASPWRGYRLIALTSFYPPVRRKACGYLFLTPRRQKIISKSLRLGVEKSGRQPPATAPDMQQQAGLSRRLAAPKSDEGGNEMKADVAQDLWGTQSRPVGTVVRRALAPTPTACVHAVAGITIVVREFLGGLYESLTDQKSLGRAELRPPKRGGVEHVQRPTQGTASR